MRYAGGGVEDFVSEPARGHLQHGPRPLRIVGSSNGTIIRGVYSQRQRQGARLP